MGLFKIPKKEEHILVLSIGSGSLGGMIFKKSAGENPEIITSTRVPINFLMDVDFGAFWRCVRDALNKVTKQLLSDFPQGPDRVLCVFSHIWGVSQTRIVKLRKDELFKVEKGLLDRLIENETDIFRREWQNSSRHMKGDFELIDSEIMKVALNGYDVKNPVGKKAKTMDMYIYMNMAMKEVKEELKNHILKNFGDVRVNFFSLPYVIFCVMKNLINADDGFIFADVGGETTDVSLVSKGVLRQSVSVPKGRNFVVREIAKKFKTFIKEAISMVESQRSGHASKSFAGKLSPLLDEKTEEWCGLMHKAIGEIAQTGPLPMKFFVLGGKYVGPEFSQCIKGERFSEFTVLGKPFNVESITADSLKQHFSFKRGFLKDGDIFLMLESLFADRILK